LAVAAACVLTGGMGGRAWAGEPAKGEGRVHRATAVGVKAIVERMQRFYERTQDFTAEFKQSYAHKTFGRTQSSSGKVLFKKPSLFRWEYEKPAAKTFLLTADRVYTFDPAAQLLTKAAVDTSQLSASVTFLMGKGKLDREFDFAHLPCEKCRGVLLELTPKAPDPRFNKIHFEVDAKTGQVSRSVVFDPNGDENTIEFENLKTNVGLTDEPFKLKPPEGTQVQDFTEKK
jgi:outer membrane lipoprotein carrier protein